MEASRSLKFTYHEYQFLPEDKRYEIMEGELYVVPAPNEAHQRISRNLEYALMQYLETHPVGELYHAPFDIILSNENVVQPDIIIILNQRKGIINTKNVKGAPDIVIEILSPSTPERDKDIKFRLYAKYGVREYWIVDPSAQSIEIFKASPDGFDLVRAFTPGVSLTSTILPELAIDLTKVFV